MMTAALHDLRILVTGGTRGIGLAIAKRLRQDGANVSITGQHKKPKTQTVFQYFGVDFADATATAAFAKQVGNLDFDVLVNNAGINRINPFVEIPDGDFQRIQQVNLYAPFALCRAAVSRMREKRWGRIVNITSIYGVITKEHRASYSASKFGLEGMTTALAVECAPDGILVNCVAPGFIETDLSKQILGEKGIKDIQEKIPMRRMGQPDEIAPLVAWLVSRENTYLTGQNIVIDGGYTRV